MRSAKAAAVEEEEEEEGVALAGRYSKRRRAATVAPMMGVGKLALVLRNDKWDQLCQHDWQRTRGAAGCGSGESHLDDGARVGAQVDTHNRHVPIAGSAGHSFDVLVAGRPLPENAFLVSGAAQLGSPDLRQIAPCAFREEPRLPVAGRAVAAEGATAGGGDASEGAHSSKHFEDPSRLVAELQAEMRSGSGNGRKKEKARSPPQPGSPTSTP